MLNFFKNKKNKFSFYGNCQLDNICNQLNASDDFRNLYEYVPVKAVYLLEKDDLKSIKEAFSKVDVLIYQGVGTNFKNGPEFASDNILTFLKKDCKKILIPSLFFNAYFPDFHEIVVNDYGVLTTPLMGSFHDLNIVYAYIKKLKCSDFAKIYSNENYYDKIYCHKLLTNALNSLQEREVDNNVDIRISDFIRENYDKQKLFNCQNHPKPPIIQYVIDNIILRLGLDIKVEVKKSCLDVLECPVHPSIYKNLNLKFEYKFEFLTSKGIINNYETITELFYDEYKKIDNDILRKGLVDWYPINDKMSL